MQKEPLVFLPGMMCDIRLFSHQLVDLAGERTLTVAPISDGETVTEIANRCYLMHPEDLLWQG